MAQFEKPINLVDFARNEKIDHRKEEEYMYKYMEMKPARKIKEPKSEANGDDTDSSMEAFADKEIEDQMKKMQ